MVPRACVELRCCVRCEENGDWEGMMDVRLGGRYGLIKC